MRTKKQTIFSIQEDLYDRKRSDKKEVQILQLFVITLIAIGTICCCVKGFVSGISLEAIAVILCIIIAAVIGSTLPWGKLVVNITDDDIQKEIESRLKDLEWERNDAQHVKETLENHLFYMDDQKQDLMIASLSLQQKTNKNP